MHRRTFLHTAAAAASGLALTGLAGCASDADSSADTTADATADATASAATGVGPVGVQLYTLRSLLESDVEGTLEQVAAMGYRTVEFAGYYDRSPDELNALLSRLKLTAPAAHLLPQDIRERPTEVLDRAAAMRHDYLVCAYLTEDDRQSLDAYRAIADLLNDFGERCADRGLQLAYHNHDFEFASMDDRRPYDVLLARTEADLVAMELDLYWIRKAGHDPLAYFAQHPGRFPLWHVKDLGADGTIVPVGNGQIDFAALFARAEQAGLRHAFVEHDTPDDPLASIRQSIGYLNGLDVGDA
mgnify:CR=1 FL=1